MDELIDIPEMPLPQRIDGAHKAYFDSQGALSIRKATKLYGVNYTTLRKRINGSVSCKVFHENQQKLSPGEKSALGEMITLIESWGWPPTPAQLRGMASDLLHAKGLLDNDKEVGEHWTDLFLQQHPELKTKFVTGLDKERRLAEDPVIITDCFQLYSDTVGKYKVHKENIHNMDEKGMMLGMVGVGS
jgi:hypothetical protein